MKFYSVFIAIAAIFLAVALFAPETDARIPKRKLKALKKIGLAAILLKGNKKFLFPLPLPLPLPLPVLQKHIPIAEPVAVAEPVAYPVAEPVYSEPLPSYGKSYGAESYAAPSYGAESYSAPSYGGKSYGAESYSAPSYGAESYSAQAYGGESQSAQSYGAEAAAPAYPSGAY